MSRVLLILLMLYTLPLWAEQEVAVPEENGEPETVETAPEPRLDQAAQRLAELRELAVEGRYVDLITDEGTAFALHLPEVSGEARGAVLLLHDTHNHLAAEPVEMLRVRLPEFGWDTLSLQMPLVVAGEDRLAWLDRAVGHIEAAVAYLQGEGLEAIALVGQGSGAHAAVDYLYAIPRDGIVGLVVISLDGGAAEEVRLDAARQLARVSVPILDIHAARDDPRVIDSTKRRATEAQRPPEDDGAGRVRYRDIAKSYTPEQGDRVHYRQLQIPGADHTYRTGHEALLRAIRGWLQRHAG